MNKLMREVLYGMSYLQENQMVHADLRPSLISVPLSPTQNFRLLDRLGNPSPPDEVQRMNIQNNEKLYTSPAIFKSILKKKKQVKHNPFKSDIFSLGMIILEAGILESVQGVYNHEKKNIDESVLVELVEKFIDRYPDDYVLQEGLMIMLEFSEKLRQTPLTMLNTLRELKETEIEEGRADLSYINYANDPMMKKVHITDSGYEYKEADQMMISNFSRIYQNRAQMSMLKSENLQEDIERSLVGIVKNKQSQINLQAKNKIKKEEDDEILDSFLKNEERAKKEQV
jgi:serine/threonine protein kinase